MSRTVWAWARPAVAAATLAVVVWRLGTGPFLDGVRAVDGAALAAAAGIGVLTTLCCAWRWTIVARGLGVRLSLPAAVAAYYRSVFLNLTLPGGVVGDVHRGVSHGRDVRDVGLALRAVAWERTAGQVVQAVADRRRPAGAAVAGALVDPAGRRSRSSRRCSPSCSSAGRDLVMGARAGRGCGARSPPTSATRSWPAGRGRRSRSRPRWSSSATRSRS